MENKWYSVGKGRLQALESDNAQIRIVFRGDDVQIAVSIDGVYMYTRVYNIYAVCKLLALDAPDADALNALFESACTAYGKRPADLNF